MMWVDWLLSRHTILAPLSWMRQMFRAKEMVFDFKCPKLKLCIKKEKQGLQLFNRP